MLVPTSENKTPRFACLPPQPDDFVVSVGGRRFDWLSRLIAAVAAPILGWSLKRQSPKDGYERVYTVTDYWDGPREGVAHFRGAPHVYRSVWRRDVDDWDDDRYFLCPITADEALLLVEDWTIWRRFADHYRGRVVPPSVQSPDEWGALPEDRPRHRELRRLFVPILSLDRARCVVARARFRSVGPPPEPGFIVPKLEVRWIECPIQPDDELLPTPGA